MNKTETPIKHHDGPCKLLLYPSILFMLVGMIVGTYLSYNAFVMPNAFSGEYVHFGRIRPVHVGTVTLLWLLPSGAGLMFYFVPRLCGIPLWSRTLGLVTGWVWWIALIVGIFSFPFGTNFGWEYAELPMWVGTWFSPKILFNLGYVLFAVNLFVTIAKRKYKKMYVSLWYTMGTLLWTPITFAISNYLILLLPGGISRVNANFFYVHNLVGLIFTPMGVAASYYFIPKEANTPLYSHKLSMIGFWSIAFIYSWVGAHHIIHGPVSQWLQTMSIIFSIWLFIPVWTVVTNFFMTMKGQWHKYQQSVSIRFSMMGTVFYLIVCIQGPLQALRNVNEVTSKTDWIIGHAHMALFGGFTFFALGGIYHAIPKMLKRPFWSKSLGDWHFTLNLIGALLMFLSLTVGGFLQGLSWADWANGSSYAEFQKNISELSFLQTLASMHGWWTVRAISGLIIVVANALFVLNVFNTVVLKPKKSLTTEEKMGEPS